MFGFGGYTGETGYNAESMDVRWGDGGIWDGLKGEMGGK